MLPTLADTCAKTHGQKEGADRAYANDISGFSNSILSVSEKTFRVHHFTSPVLYDLESIIEKNREAVSNDLLVIDCK